MHSKYWLAGLLCCALAACGNKSTPEAQTPDQPPLDTPPPSNTTNPEPAPTSPQPATEPSAALPPLPSSEDTAQAQPPIVTEPARAPLTDGQIAAITDAANTSEVE